MTALDSSSVNAASAIAIAAELERAGRVVYPGFLSAEEVRCVRADLEFAYQRGDFRRAGVGQGAGKVVQDEIRRDDIAWLEREGRGGGPGSNPAQIMLWAKLDALLLAFNRGLFLGLNDFEGHYAKYPAGGFYRRHLDSFSNPNANPNPRTVSLILYLNEDWGADDGGELRIYDRDGTHTDIQPVGGTLVCFLSQDIEHEVIPSRRERASFTGWFKRPA